MKNEAVAFIGLTYVFCIYVIVVCLGVIWGLLTVGAGAFSYPFVCYLDPFLCTALPGPTYLPGVTYCFEILYHI